MRIQRHCFHKAVVLPYYKSNYLPEKNEPRTNAIHAKDVYVTGSSFLWHRRLCHSLVRLVFMGTGALWSRGRNVKSQPQFNSIKTTPYFQH